jgi:hypothetical protein
VLFGEFAFAAHNFGLAGFEVAFALDLGVVVFLDGGVAELDAFGLAGLGQQDEWCSVGRLGGERQVEQDERVRSHWKLNAAPLAAIQRTTRTVWPMMKRGVPKNRAKRSARTPKRPMPNAP